jgi:hypothetical protein
MAEDPASRILSGWMPRSGAPSHRRQMIVALVVRVSLFALAIGAIAFLTAPIWSAALPEPVPRSGNGRRFGLTLEERRAVFTELVRNEARNRAHSAERFAGDPFSINDDRSWGEMHDARELARRRGLSLSQVYLVLDEGIRARWPGPDGAPLAATVPPLDPRR